MSTLEITDLTVSYAAANAGDHNVPIAVTVPAELVDLNPDYYILHFLTADYQSISSSNLTAVDGVVSFALTDELTVAGLLKMRIGAYDMTGLELTTAGYSDVCTLIIGNGIPDGITGNTEYQGLMAELQTALAAAAAATPLIVNTNGDLPTTAADGKEVIVREIDQTFPWNLKNIDSILGYETPVLVSAQQKGVCIKKTPPKPDFTALGISPQVLISTWSTVFGNIKPYRLGSGAPYIHWHTGMHVDLYDMYFFPAGFFIPIDMLAFNDLMWDWGNPDSSEGRIKYFYIWDTAPVDPENPESDKLLPGWYEATAWDEEDNNITVFIAIPEMPDIRMSCSAAFEDNAAGLKAAEYFATVCNDRPFTNRRYLRDCGQWILLN